MIKEHLKLQFDPMNPTKVPEVKDVFQNPLAQVIWLAARPGHIASQYFESSCLRSAQKIQKILDAGRELDAKLLNRILSNFGKPPFTGVIGQNEPEFCEALLPFIKGEKTITYEVCLAQSP